MRKLSMVLLAAFASTASAQTPAAPDTLFTRTDTMITMRDGVKLFTAILTPRNAKGPLPLLMTRTPYGADGGARNLMSGRVYPELVASGYIFVYQDIRGLNKSQGQFVMNRPSL